MKMSNYTVVQDSRRNLYLTRLLKWTKDISQAQIFNSNKEARDCSTAWWYTTPHFMSVKLKSDLKFKKVQPALHG